MERKPKTLLYDLEVSREVVEGYRNKYDFNVVKVIRHQFMMSYSYKWLGEKTIHFRHMHGYEDMKSFVQSLRDLEDEADITIAHNLRRFDDVIYLLYAYVFSKISLDFYSTTYG